MPIFKLPHFLYKHFSNHGNSTNKENKSPCPVYLPVCPTMNDSYSLEKNRVKKVFLRCLGNINVHESALRFELKLGGPPFS